MTPVTLAATHPGIYALMTISNLSLTVWNVAKSALFGSGALLTFGQVPEWNHETASALGEAAKRAAMSCVTLFGTIFPQTADNWIDR